MKRAACARSTFNSASGPNLLPRLAGKLAIPLMHGAGPKVFLLLFLQKKKNTYSFVNKARAETMATMRNQDGRARGARA
jgi:hypothetical protein